MIYRDADGRTQVSGLTEVVFTSLADAHALLEHVNRSRRALALYFALLDAASRAHEAASAVAGAAANAAAVAAAVSHATGAAAASGGMSPDSALSPRGRRSASISRASHHRGSVVGLAGGAVDPTSPASAAGPAAARRGSLVGDAMASASAAMSMAGARRPSSIGASARRGSMRPFSAASASAASAGWGAAAPGDLSASAALEGGPQLPPVSERSLLGASTTIVSLTLQGQDIRSLNVTQSRAQFVMLPDIELIAAIAGGAAPLAGGSGGVKSSASQRKRSPAKSRLAGNAGATPSRGFARATSASKSRVSSSAAGPDSVTATPAPVMATPVKPSASTAGGAADASPEASPEAAAAPAASAAALSAAQPAPYSAEAAETAARGVTVQLSGMAVPLSAVLAWRDMRRQLAPSAARALHSVGAALQEGGRAAAAAASSEGAARTSSSPAEEHVPEPGSARPRSARTPARSPTPGKASTSTGSDASGSVTPAMSLSNVRRAATLSEADAALSARASATQQQLAATTLSPVAASGRRGLAGTSSAGAKASTAPASALSDASQMLAVLAAAHAPPAAAAAALTVAAVARSVGGGSAGGAVDAAGKLGGTPTDSEDIVLSLLEDVLTGNGRVSMLVCVPSGIDVSDVDAGNHGDVVSGVNNSADSGSPEIAAALASAVAAALSYSRKAYTPPVKSALALDTELTQSFPSSSSSASTTAAGGRSAGPPTAGSGGSLFAAQGGAGRHLIVSAAARERAAADLAAATVLTAGQRVDLTAATAVYEAAQQQAGGPGSINIPLSGTTKLGGPAVFSWQSGLRPLSSSGFRSVALRRGGGGAGQAARLGARVHELESRLLEMREAAKALRTDNTTLTREIRVLRDARRAAEDLQESLDEERRRSSELQKVVVTLRTNVTRAEEDEARASDLLERTRIQVTDLERSLKEAILAHSRTQAQLASLRSGQELARAKLLESKRAWLDQIGQRQRLEALVSAYAIDDRSVVVAGGGDPAEVLGPVSAYRWLRPASASDVASASAGAAGQELVQYQDAAGSPSMRGRQVSGGIGARLFPAAMGSSGPILPAHAGLLMLGSRGTDHQAADAAARKYALRARKHVDDETRAARAAAAENKALATRVGSVSLHAILFPAAVTLSIHSFILALSSLSPLPATAHEDAGAGATWLLPGPGSDYRRQRGRGQGA